MKKAKITEWQIKKLHAANSKAIRFFYEHNNTNDVIRFFSRLLLDVELADLNLSSTEKIVLLELLDIANDCNEAKRKIKKKYFKLDNVVLFP